MGLALYGRGLVGMKLHRELIPAAAGSGIAPCPAVDKNAINKKDPNKVENFNLIVSVI